MRRQTVASTAALSAAVTYAHPEAVAAAIAVAVAAVLAVRGESAGSFLAAVAGSGASTRSP